MSKAGNLEMAGSLGLKIPSLEVLDRALAKEREAHKDGKCPQECAGLIEVLEASQEVDRILQRGLEIMLDGLIGGDIHGTTLTLTGSILKVGITAGLLAAQEMKEGEPCSMLQ